MGWLKENLLEMKVINPSELEANHKASLLATYAQWSRVRFPSLIDQLKTSFPGRLAIDRSVSNALSLSLRDEDIVQLYKTVATRIEWLRDLLTRE